jgi:alkanesulfonate monooxygenase SsuD/methylene tetrahydromethanopterin reductase-like flavin-dependent oxidoreductase (luciferase family)
MEFGIQFFPTIGPTEKAADQYFAECLALCSLADPLGYTHIRTVEHYFERYGGYSPNPLTFLAAASQRSRHARLITGAVLPVFQHPLKLAGEIGMVDALCGGRLDVGVARAFLPHEFHRFGISMDESVERFREGLEQLELLLTREQVCHEGKFHRFPATTSLPRPTQKPRPKFYVAAVATPESFEFAGRMGHSVMSIPVGGPRMRELLEIYREAWCTAGHPGRGEVMIAFHMLCDGDGARARDLARPLIQQYMAAQVEAAAGFLQGEPSKDYKGYDKMMAAMRSVDLDSMIASGGAWVGSPAEIRWQIEQVASDSGGFEHASMQVNFVTMPVTVARRSMELFAAEVMPHFTNSQAQT